MPLNIPHHTVAVNRGPNLIELDM